MPEGIKTKMKILSADCGKRVDTFKVLQLKNATPDCRNDLARHTS